MRDKAAADIMSCVTICVARKKSLISIIRLTVSEPITTMQIIFLAGLRQVSIFARLHDTARPDDLCVWLHVSLG